MNFEQTVHEWFSRLDKGYAVPPYTKHELAVLESIVNRNMLTENAQWDQLILDAYPDGVPDPVGTYQLPQGKTGKIEINAKDKPVFIKLFKLKPGAGTGNGEISLYWLFKKTAQVESTGKGAAADLRIGGVNCEVKSYSRHDSKIKLGKFKELKNSRQIISRVFGILNLTKSFDSTKDTNFFTETKFNTEDLRKGFESLLELNTTVFNNPEIAPFLSKVPAFKQMKAEVQWVLKTFEGKDTDVDLAKACMAKILSEKLALKPGFGGYMINCLKNNPTDVKAFYIPKDVESVLRGMDFDRINSNTSINSGEIEINYSELFG